MITLIFSIMYFLSQQEPFCVNCDWLQFSVLTDQSEPEIMCPEGLRLEICQGNNIFAHRALVYDGRGAKYLTLLWAPYSKVLQQNLMTVQVANEFLYFAGGQGIKWAWADVQKIVDCTFNAIGRLDICIDYQGTPVRNEFLRHLNSGHYYVQGKHEGSTWWHEVAMNKKQLHCLAWGSKKSEIKVKIYHKSREQGLSNENDQPEKPWIIDQWKEAGMNILNVWRLEFSLAGAGQLRYKGMPLTLEMVADCDWLLGTLCELYDHKFVCRLNEGKRNGHHNDDARVWLFRLPPKPQEIKWADPKGKDNEVPAAITLLRSMMRQLDNPAIMCVRSTFQDYATTILNLIRDHRLSGYFIRTYEAQPEPYFEELWTNVGAGIRHAAPAPSRLMD